MNLQKNIEKHSYDNFGTFAIATLETKILIANVVAIRLEYKKFNLIKIVFISGIFNEAALDIFVAKTQKRNFLEKAKNIAKMDL